MTGLRWLALLLLAVMLCACGGDATVRRAPAVKPVPYPDAPEPRAEPLSKYGNPESYVVFGKRYYTLKSAKGFTEQGIASWYGQKFHGRRTSSGEIYDMYQMTAAHKHLPLPTYVEVRNLENGRTAVLRVNDRGPFHENRVIDLSYAAALKLDVVRKGTAFVEVRALDPGQHRRPRAAPARTVEPAAAAPATQTSAQRSPQPDAPAEVAPARPPQAAETAQPTETPEAPAEVATAPVGDAAAAPMVADVYIQLGAFQDIANARRLAERIEAVAPGAVHIRELLSQGRTLHRVQIGPIVSVDYADAVVAGLERLGITEHHFVTQ